MSNRPNLMQTSPDAYKALRGVEVYIAGSGLDHSLIELVKMRASQINGCAFCLNMHSSDARKGGETEQRLYLLNAWRETKFYTPKERAALAWTEHLTRVSTDGAPEHAYRELTEHFSPKEIADLTLLIGQINLWNRIAIGTAMEPPAA
jgi:AhpD family alkylhydroperoxidase